jgi:hypothetical protein
MADFRVIGPDTQKDIAANEVNKKFADVYDGLLTSVDRMTGFIVIVFDEYGAPQWKVFVGEKFPIPTPMLPEVAKECARASVYGGR